MIKDEIHKKICENYQQVQDWFTKESEGLFFPFSSSYDIRESKFKVAPVDANLFPAGFNNICAVDQESAGDKVKTYFTHNYPNVTGTVALVCESHTKNAYYWQNVSTLVNLMRHTGLNIKIAIPSEERQPTIEVESIMGEKINIDFIYKKDNDLLVNEEKPELVISNNDFSVAITSWLEGFSQEMNPPIELGWHKRRKITFFDNYNKLAQEFADVLGISAESLTVKTEIFSNFDINSEESRIVLAKETGRFIDELRDNYKKHAVADTPFTFIKNSSGTYGLGVKQVTEAQEIMSWSYKDRKKMKAVKGGGTINEVIIQEGIPTVFTTDSETAEPTIYMVGSQLIGGFIRAHSKKGPRESLNSPGAVYKKLCVSDLQVRALDCPMENVYGWVAKLSSLAVAKEIKELKG